MKITLDVYDSITRTYITHTLRLTTADINGPLSELMLIITTFVKKHNSRLDQLVYGYESNDSNEIDRLQRKIEGFQKISIGFNQFCKSPETTLSVNNEPSDRPSEASTIHTKKTKVFQYLSCAVDILSYKSPQAALPPRGKAIDDYLDSSIEASYIDNSFSNNSKAVNDVEETTNLSQYAIEKDNDDANYPLPSQWISASTNTPIACPNSYLTETPNIELEKEPITPPLPSTFMLDVLSHPTTQAVGAILILAGVSTALVGFGVISGGTGYAALLITMSAILHTSTATASITVGSFGASIAALTTTGLVCGLFTNKKDDGEHELVTDLFESRHSFE